MPFISYSAGLTMHIGSPSNNEYVKLTLEVKDIDTEVDFNTQLEKVHLTAHQLMNWTDEVLAGKMEEALAK